jgi:hypothetical protein
MEMDISWNIGLNGISNIVGLGTKAHNYIGTRYNLTPLILKYVTSCAY